MGTIGRYISVIASWMLTMTWLIDYQIKDVDIYFTDPENYGSYVQAVEVELCPTDNILKGWRLDV